MAEELYDIINDAGVIKLCTVHMRRLVDDVLALSKIGKQPFAQLFIDEIRQQYPHRYAHRIASRVHLSASLGYGPERNARTRCHLQIRSQAGISSFGCVLG
jgi:hypothetical protein